MATYEITTVEEWNNINNLGLEEGDLVRVEDDLDFKGKEYVTPVLEGAHLEGLLDEEDEPLVRIKNIGVEVNDSFVLINGGFVEGLCFMGVNVVSGRGITRLFSNTELVKNTKVEGNFYVSSFSMFSGMSKGLYGGLVFNIGVYSLGEIRFGLISNVTITRSRFLGELVTTGNIKLNSSLLDNTELNMVIDGYKVQCIGGFRDCIIDGEIDVGNTSGDFKDNDWRGDWERVVFKMNVRGAGIRDVELKIKDSILLSEYIGEGVGRPYMNYFLRIPGDDRSHGSTEVSFEEATDINFYRNVLKFNIEEI